MHLHHYDHPWDVPIPWTLSKTTLAMVDIANVWGFSSNILGEIYGSILIMPKHALVNTLKEGKSEVGVISENVPIFLHG